MLWGQEEEEEEGEVGGCVADKFNEGFFDEEPQRAFGSQKVDQREDREEQADNETHDQLNCPVTTTPARKSIIP